MAPSIAPPRKEAISSPPTSHHVDKPADDDLLLFRIFPSLVDPVTVDTTRLFINALRHDADPIIFGLAGEGSTQEVYVAAIIMRGHVSTFRDVLTAHFPNLEMQQVTETPAFAKGATKHLTYKTENDIYRLACLTDLQPDPYATLVNAFAKLKPDEGVLFTTRFFKDEVPVEHARLNRGLAMIQDAMAENDPIATAAGNVDDFDKKSASPLWRAWIELTIRGSDATVASISATCDQFMARFASQRTKFVPTERKPGGDPFKNLLATTGMLTTDELVGLVHVPHKSLQHPALVRLTGDRKPAPDLLTRHGIIVGTRQDHGKRTQVRIPDEERTRHIYVIGKSGSGKSTCLLNLIRQDIEAGAGVAVIDPHGDLCEDLLNFIPETRVPDAIYFNAADRTAPIALNVMRAEDDAEIALLTDDLIVTFRRLSDGWGQRMEHILGFVFQTLLRVPGATLLDVRTILLDEAKRQRMLRKITFPPILEFWRNEFPGFSKDALQPILSRMGKFALSPTLYGILGQAESRLDFFDVIQNKKIFLANLSQGKIGTDTSQLLGSLLVSQLQLATMRRANLPKEARESFYLYVDEFQNFTTSAFDKILSEARKYRLCLTMAHQYISQLSDEVRSSILNNTGTIIMFPLGAQDAACLKSELGAFTPEDLANLSFQDHEVLCRPPTKSSDTFKFQTLPPAQAPSRTFSREVIEYTQMEYSTVPKPTNPVVLETDNVAARGLNGASPAPLPRRDALSASERILYHVKLAEYLSTQQIIELCYAHVSQSAQATAASRDLRQLVDAGNLKVQPFGRGNIYYTSRTCNPTSHNLAVRDLLVKILRSEYDVAEVNFNLNLRTVLPDLFVSFTTKSGQLIKTLWEFDTGTEPTAEILKKVNRYHAFPEYSPIVCIVRDSARMTQLQGALPDSPLWFAVMDDFTSLKEPAFHHGTAVPQPLFSEGAALAATLSS